MSRTAEQLIIGLGWEHEMLKGDLEEAATEELQRCLEILAQPSDDAHCENLSRHAEFMIHEELKKRALPREDEKVLGSP